MPCHTMCLRCDLVRPCQHALGTVQYIDFHPFRINFQECNFPDALFIRIGIQFHDLDFNGLKASRLRDG